jgi:hypothetical protein
MSRVFAGRYTAQIDGPFVVFLIGMRVNKLWKIGKWLPVAREMRPMVEELMAHRELGLLHAQTFLYWRGIALVQYWRSFEQLEQYARNPSLSHLDAWRRFNKAVGADGSVGIWHETYLVQGGQHESVYGNMPRMGLARAGNHESISRRKETARRRVGLDGEPAVDSYETPPER